MGSLSGHFLAVSPCSYVGMLGFARAVHQGYSLSFTPHIASKGISPPPLVEEEDWK